MSDLSIHANGHTERTPSAEHQGPVASVVAMGREALRSAVEVVKFAANTFTAAGEDRNRERYGDKAHSDRGVERHLSGVIDTQAAQDRRARRAERSADWEYGVVGRARIAAHNSALTAIAMNRTPRHPSQVPGYRRKSDKKS